MPADVHRIICDDGFQNRPERDGRRNCLQARVCSLVLSVLWLAATPAPAQQLIDDSRADQVYLTAAVATDHEIASQAGLEMLKRGGNAVDAAVATSFCLSVVRPYSCGIGGGGFMLIHIPAADDRPSRTVAINYREMAPAAVDGQYYMKLDDPLASTFGPHAVAVPGTVAGLAHALQAYGTLDLATTLQPAIRAAEQGISVDASFIAAMHETAAALNKHPRLRDLAQPIWENFCAAGALKVGDILRQPEKARALRLIADAGPKAFYDGAIADAIVEAVQQRGGPLTKADLANFRVSESQPLSMQFLDHTILAMPPPSSGGIAMQQIFGILQHRSPDLQNLKHNSPAYIHLVAEAMKHAFADRSRWLADPAFVDVPVSRLTAPEYLAELARRVSLDSTALPEHYGTSHPIPEDGGTSHFCVIDGSGMAVACTETINTIYGSLLLVPEFGIVLNNEMDDFTTIPGQPNAFGLVQSELGLPAPGKRPLSSMSPTIVLKDDRVVLIAGGSGGPRIISATTQVILNSLWFEMLPRDAVNSQRFHHQWLPDQLELEREIMTAKVPEELRQRGHDVRQAESAGVIQLIHVGGDGIRAASDPRKGGTPAGY